MRPGAFDRLVHQVAPGALADQVDRPVPPRTLLEQDTASAAKLGYLLEGPIRTLSQAAMVFCLMNRDIHTVVPGVKNTKEAEETAASVDVPPIPEHHLERLQELYRTGFAG